MTPVQQFVIKRFVNLYGAPNATDLPKFFGEYAKALGKVDGKRLEKAIDLVVSRNTFHIWPTPGVCVAAVSEVALAHERERDFANYKSADWRREPTKAEKARVREIAASCKESLAAQAAETRSQEPGFAGIDRKAWTTRQAGLIEAGKWCLSNASGGRAT